MRQSRGNARTRRLATALALVVVLGSVVMVARTDDSGPTDLSGLAVLAVLGLLVLFVVVDLGLRLAGVDGEAPEIAEHLVSDPDQQRLLTRWLARARWARFVGGLSGLIAWGLGTNGHGDLLLFGTGGIAAGAVVAEMHHIRRARGPRTARLDVRAVRHYLTDRDLHRMVGVAIVAAAAGGTGVWSGETRAATWWSAGALASLGAAALAQRRVATRARPALSDKLTHADDLVRELAIGRGLARPATFFALAMVARACFDLEPTIDGFARLLGVCAWIYAAVLWWYNRRLGLDFVMTERDPLLA